jgi:ribosome-associated heat shock protein Hsp15
MPTPEIPAHAVRIDKWLWAARFFKTRSLASDACDAGKILVNQQPAKPSRVVKLADTLQITNEGGVFTIKILELSDERGSATVAQTMYQETDASRELRAKVAEARRIMLQEEPSFARAKPSKRDRRLIHSFRGRE